MTVEQLVRDQLDRATQDVPAGPDLESSVSAGRRQRRHRRAGLAVAAVAVAGVGAVGVNALVAGPDVVHDAPPAGAPAPTDFVPGTDIDTSMAAVVAEHLPGLPGPDDVYPSDVTHDGPMPDADFASATEWQAVYALPGGGRLLVLMGRPAEAFACEGCTAQDVQGGTVYVQTYRTIAPSEEVFVDSDQTVEAAGGQVNRGVTFVTDDGFLVAAYERTEPGQQPRLTDGELAELVVDGRLTFA